MDVAEYVSRLADDQSVSVDVGLMRAIESIDEWWVADCTASTTGLSSTLNYWSWAAARLGECCDREMAKLALRAEIRLRKGGGGFMQQGVVDCALSILDDEEANDDVVAINAALAEIGEEATGWQAHDMSHFESGGCPIRIEKRATPSQSVWEA